MLSKSPRFISVFLLLLLAILILRHASAPESRAAGTTLAYTSFEEPGTGGQYTDTGNNLTDHPLLNNPGEAPVNYTSTGGELGFTSYYFNTRNGVGLTDGDFVGVTDFTGTVGSFPDGSQGFQISDPDGKMRTSFDTVTLTTLVTPTVSLQFFLQETGWESNDLLRIWVEVDGGAELDLVNTAGSDIDDLGIEGAWLVVQLDLTGYATATLSVELDANAASEALYVDNVRFYDDTAFVPTVAIPAIQGTGSSSLYAGDVVQTSGVVVADYQSASELGGFFLQDPAGDGDAATSDGIFVVAGTPDVAVGDTLTLTAQVVESLDLTALLNVTDLTVGSGMPLPAPAVLPLPELTDGDLEAYEGMLVQVDGDMTVAQNYFLGRYGQMTLSAGARLYQPTQLYPPASAERAALAGANARRLLLLDDGQDADPCGDNPVPVPYLGPPPPAVIRAGDRVTNLVGVLDYGQINSNPCFGSPFPRDYRLHPTQAPVFGNDNPRTAVPHAVGGSLQVASFNVLNYFNGDGSGGGFPTSRGADTLSEFNRQRDKIIAAIIAIDADVIGLMELENDYGDGSLSAIADLVNGLNTVAGAGTYAYVDPGANIGTDEIAVGLIYQTASVSTLGSHALLDDSFDPAYDDSRNRPALAQTFQETAGGERFTVVVNHLKSKGSACGAGDDDPVQGNCNGTRTTAVGVEVAWLATDPTGSGDPDFLVLGDMNAYAQEDPMQVFAGVGYTDLAAYFVGVDAYSYIFDGNSGTLDYALANDALLAQVTGATQWHINTDEPTIIDYDEDFNPAGYYSSTVYRASDHDPVIVGLDLGGTITAFNSVQNGTWQASATWDVPATPDAAGAVTITTGTTVTLASDARARHLTIAPGGTLAIPAGVTLSVEGTLLNQGEIRHTMAAVPAGQTARFGLITNGSGGGIKYRGVDVTPASGGMGSTTVAIRGFQSGCSGDPADPLVRRCYDIEPTTPQTATLRFWYSEGERNGQDANGTAVWHYASGLGWGPDPAGSPYAYSEITGNCLSHAGQACWVEARGVGSYSPFALGDAVPSPAAIFLNLSGVVTATNTAVRLTWTPTTYGSYQLWQSSAPYAGYAFYQQVIGTAFLETAGVTDPANNYFYEIYVDSGGRALGQTNRLGIFIFAITPGQ